MAIDPLGLGVVIRLLASSCGSAVLVTNASPSVMAVVNQLLPEGQPGLLVLPAPRLARAGAVGRLLRVAERRRATRR